MCDEAAKMVRPDLYASHCPAQSGSAACYVAITSEVAQVSPDAWHSFVQTKICDRNTTLGEIIDWYWRFHKGEKHLDNLRIVQTT